MIEPPGARGGAAGVAWGYLASEDAFDARVGPCGAEGAAPAKRPRKKAAAGGADVGASLSTAAAARTETCKPEAALQPNIESNFGGGGGGSGGGGSISSGGGSDDGFSTGRGGSLSAKERLAMTRERNRHHSRKSRQKKKQFITGGQGRGMLVLCCVGGEPRLTWVWVLGPNRFTQGCSSRRTILGCSSSWWSRPPTPSASTRRMTRCVKWRGVASLVIAWMTDCLLACLRAPPSTDSTRRGISTFLYPTPACS